MWLIQMQISLMLIPPRNSNIDFVRGAQIFEFPFIFDPFVWREKCECKMPRKPDWAKRKQTLSRPCWGGNYQCSFMLWGWEKILSAEVLESTDKNLCLSLLAAWCGFHLGIRKDWNCFGWACEIQHQWRRESDWPPSPHHQPGSHLHPVWFW